MSFISPTVNKLLWAFHVSKFRNENLRPLRCLEHSKNNFIQKRPLLDAENESSYKKNYGTKSSVASKISKILKVQKLYSEVIYELLLRSYQFLVFSQTWNVAIHKITSEDQWQLEIKKSNLSPEKIKKKMKFHKIANPKKASKFLYELLLLTSYEQFFPKHEI